jgi:hypothetical protein
MTSIGVLEKRAGEKAHMRLGEKAHMRLGEKAHRGLEKKHIVDYFIYIRSDNKQCNKL